jgi:hypothetical protein
MEPSPAVFKRRLSRIAKGLAPPQGPLFKTSARADSQRRRLLFNASMCIGIMMSERIQYLQQQAAKARRLAKSIPDDEAANKLLKLAEEYEALAKQEQPEEDSKDTMH